jgi:hypothetical protein
VLVYFISSGIHSYTCSLLLSRAGGDSKALCIYKPHICIMAVTTALGNNKAARLHAAQLHCAMAVGGLRVELPELAHDVALSGTQLFVALRQEVLE